MQIQIFIEILLLVVSLSSFSLTIRPGLIHNFSAMCYASVYDVQTFEKPTIESSSFMNCSTMSLFGSIVCFIIAVAIEWMNKSVVSVI